jgi:hypothetical protein
MTDINLTGIPGTPGVNGTTPGQPGTAGGPGGDAVPAQNTGNGIDTLNTEEATGGAGGAGGNGYSGSGTGGNAGAGGNGGNATASTSTTLNSTAGITSTATATGGAGGHAGIPGNFLNPNTGQGANGGDGGTAAASAASANGAGVARATATATGGYGGYGGLGAGGAGGIASNSTASASGFSAYATATQSGGAGGGSFIYGPGGAGASSTLTDAVNGTTAGGTLGLYQTATGGAGGNNAFYGIGGQAGTATSSLTFNDVTANSTHASTLIGSSAATGGAGGGGDYSRAAGGAATAAIALTGASVVNATATAGGGAGGWTTIVGGNTGGAAAATSLAASTGTAAASTATADSTATGGIGGAGGLGSGTTQGSATAHATATTANGELATATATATGATGSDDSTAVTQGVGAVTAVSAFAQAQVGGTATTLAESNSGNQLGSSGFDGTNNNSYAFATEVPSSSLVTGILNANSNLATALGNGSVLGLATEGASYSTTASGSRTYTSTIAWTLDTTAVSGHLIAGLINDQSFGSGFDSLDFNVVENGTTIFDQNFTTLSAAQTFFTNHALDLGTFTSRPNQVIDFNFSLTTSASGTGFGAQFLLGTTGPVLTGQVVLNTGTEGVALPSTTTVATFTDPNTSDTASIFTATINWGDGTTTTGAVSGSNGTFTVKGGHTYADEGSFPLGVTITDKANSTSLPLSGTVAAAEADVLSARGLTFRANAGQAFTGRVATFTDRNTGNVANDFSATINWGDGTTGAGAITDTRGAISVSGTHTYASSGQDAVTVTLMDDAPGTATATAKSTANVQRPGGHTRSLALLNGDTSRTSQSAAELLSGVNGVAFHGIDLPGLSLGGTSTLAHFSTEANAAGSSTAIDDPHGHTLALLGQYMASTFVLPSDGHSGTTINEPQDQQNHLSLPHAG